MKSIHFTQIALDSSYLPNKVCNVISGKYMPIWGDMIKYNVGT